MAEGKYRLKETDISDFKYKALNWAASFEVACFLDSNNYPDKYSAFDSAIAAGTKAEISAQGNAFSKLQFFLDANESYAFGYLSYDLKNEIEELSSENPDNLRFASLYFFVPEFLLFIKGKELIIEADEPDEVFKAIQNTVLPKLEVGFKGNIKSKLNKGKYLETIRKIKRNIAKGDIYEATFCQEFFSENCSINPVQAFTKLNQISPTPFAAFFKHKENYIISASPERFLRKQGNKLISQPIKGTIERGETPEEDEEMRHQLKNSIKEQSENVMIVDLVRNDLTKSASEGTVEVEELYGIYSFKQVHQMISTVVCKANKNIKHIRILKNTFPPGSMTGAPKIRAMQLTEQYEQTKRGVYSGSIGYFSPAGDFDFSVVIRTILYNADKKYLSYQTGSAITFDSDPKKEYEECLLKAEAIREVLGG